MTMIRIISDFLGKKVDMAIETLYGTLPFFNADDIFTP
jgi:hypothetical protein